jgi:putative hydrolase of the HAD superfamily
VGKADPDFAQAVIFDLDNCLSAADEIGAQLFEPAFVAIRAASGNRHSERALAAAFADMWRHALDWVAAAHGFTPAMREAAWRQLSQLQVTTPMHGYDDLHLLAQVPAVRFLVTSGFKMLQESKIRALGIADLFKGIYIDAIDGADRSGKRGIFEQIMSTHDLVPADVWVVGDNPESELAAAQSLGLRAVQMLRPGVLPSDCASHHVAGLRELIELMASSART